MEKHYYLRNVKINSHLIITIMILVNNRRNQTLAEGGRLAAKLRKFSGSLHYSAPHRISSRHIMVTSDLPASHVPFMMYSITHWATFLISSTCSYQWTLFLGAFGKLRKATVSFVMSVCPSARMENLCCHWKDFHKILCSNIFGKSVEKIKV